MKILDRAETVAYLLNKATSGERVVASRYGDGEFLLMTKGISRIATETPGRISELLIKAIKTKDQLVCIPYLKPHNIIAKDVWVQAFSYLTEVSNQEIFGCANWNILDFISGSKTIANFFKGRVLIVTGIHQEAESFFKGCKTINIYQTPREGASKDYLKIKEDLLAICKNYDNIIFATGPLSKVLVADLIDECHANLIDLGSLLNAILHMPDSWTMSWAHKIPLKMYILRFKDATSFLWK